MPMSIEEILKAAKKMKIGDRENFVCDHVPTSVECQHLVIEVAKHHKITPAVNWSGTVNITISLPVPIN